MRKLLAIMLVLGLTAFTGNFAFAQDNTENTETTADPQPAAEQPAPAPAPKADAEKIEEDLKGTQVLKKYFIEGGWQFMTFVLVCLILGLAFCIERIITLNIATVNTDKLLSKVDGALASGDIEQAKEICKSTQGPTASILYEGLNRADEGLESVEKAIVNYGSVQMGLLERGLVWISLFISIAPMLGFMGTVLGMIGAFEAIAASNDISPAVVAGGIKVALLTTVFGLVVAIILQVFYNYIVSKIDGIVNRMEEASATLVDLMVKHNVAK